LHVPVLRFVDLRFFVDLRRLVPPLAGRLDVMPF
jgi:hypothetical protein